jgi:O-glycosyl hydrolase
MNRALRTAAFAVLSLMMYASFGQTGGSVIIDLNEEFQHISGFGGANIPDWTDDLNSDQAEKAFGNAPGQIGLSILRIKAPNNEALFEMQVPTAVRARNLGSIIIASPWSPPASMKSNSSDIGGYLNPDSYGAYAGHLLGFVEFMESNGAPLYAISIQNEPDVTVTYESCDWTPEQMTAFLKEQGPKFDSIRVIVSESYHFDKSQTDPILNDPEAEQHVAIIGGHIYGGGLSDYPLAREKGKEVWMTEHFTDAIHMADEWPLALNVGAEIHRCMNANYSAYLWWYLRRFYGLIGENGNITKRGYVMSHFAKFIRPGYTRVGVPVNPVSNVDVSAYKTDSTLVVIALNRNPAPAEVCFEIQNGSLDTLTMFTTSAGKNVENGGIVVLSSGTFSASLDAQSITTFTSFPDNAGRALNIPPVADAGDDQNLLDEDDGMETVFLDGSGSSDPDGSITNFSWALDDIQFAWSESTSLSLSSGTHSIVLTVTDNDGATHMDTVDITVQSSYVTEDNLWLEAECGEVGSNWDILPDADASNGLYVTAKPGIENINSASESEQDHIIIPFEISEAGSFKIWGRAKVPTADDDSFWIKMDDGSWIKWNNIPGGTTWQWDDVHDSDQGGGFITCDLTAGSHTLTICHREDGALLDKLYITKTGGTPSGAGDDASNCEPTGEIKIGHTEHQVSLYPNPASETLFIELEGASGPVDELFIYNSLGTQVAVMKPENGKYLLDVSGLPKGVYFLRILTGNHEVYAEKFIRL